MNNLRVSMSECRCCYEDCEPLEYKINGDWKSSVYCYNCALYIRDARWTTIKNSILKIDCLAAFNRIVASGIPLVLTVSDLTEEKNNNGLVEELRYRDTTSACYVLCSSSISSSLTESTRDALLASLLRLRDSGDIQQDQIITTCEKYI
jgi:hypothetical protein